MALDSSGASWGLATAFVRTWISVHRIPIQSLTSDAQVL
jgi:hypothetical protein